MIGTRNATRVPLRMPGRGLIRVGDAEPIEFHAAMVSASSSASDGHDLELRPFVVGRELTPMELRVTRGTNGVGGRIGSAQQNDLSRLVREIAGAVAIVEQVRSRRLCPDPLPDILDRGRLGTDRPAGGVPFALVDLPDQLRQKIRWWEPGAERQPADLWHRGSRHGRCAGLARHRRRRAVLRRRPPPVRDRRWHARTACRAAARRRRRAARRGQPDHAAGRPGGPGDRPARERVRRESHCPRTSS